MSDEDSDSSGSFEESEDVSDGEPASEANASSAQLSSYSTDDDDNDDNDNGEPPSSKLQSTWRKNVSSVEAELQKSNHSRGNNNGIATNSQTLFGGPAEFGGSRHSHSNNAVDEESDDFYHKIMSRRTAGTTNGINTENADVDKEDSTNILQSSLSKLAVEDVSELQDMLVDSDNEEEVKRSFRNVVTPGHVRNNREFYETLKEKKPELSNLEDHDTSDHSDDDADGILKEQNDHSKEELPPNEDEEIKVLILERRAEKARGDPNHYHSSQEDMDTRQMFEDLGQNSSRSNSNNSGDDGSGKEIHDEKDDEDTDDSDVKECDDDKISAIWRASVKDEENDLNRSGRSGGFNESGKMSFRRQKELMDSGRLSSFHSSEQEMDLSTDPTRKTSRNELREDLEAQVKERFQAKDEETKRELERSLHRADSKPLEKKESNSVERNNNDDLEELMMDTTPFTTVSQKKTRLGQLGDFISSQSCIYVLIACVCLMVGGVIVLAVFFARA
ncbi:hypothetical protein IV203_003398 [Nitzschia inconspicua]|uniref:Uncharacterized protein n=1 Tax=Nitzschia inconspicua TaxID=303405 RepID=A0A9K3PNM2_9STRA|nr:hypothetical protein IV203_003398 [Nitzschia inconspicua]